MTAYKGRVKNPVSRSPSSATASKGAWTTMGAMRAKAESEIPFTHELESLFGDTMAPNIE